MKKEINKAEVAEFNRFSKIFSILFIVSIIVFVPVLVFLRIYEAVIWAIFYLITLRFGIKAEKLKKIMGGLVALGITNTICSHLCP